MAGRKKFDRNYLERIPVRNQEYAWKENDRGFVVVDMPHRGMFDRIAQKMFFTPPVSHIRLDPFGSYVWKQIDGSRNLIEIGKLVREQFGDRAEPLYERLAQYFQTLKDNKFIRFRSEK